ncbi:hypothetical protein BU15DRAFT_61521 [Melanogaster broomeanus]|nr:hypothetical protein BU15DRAFT_61521 [Melanogaster broomeanus]
MSSNPPVPTSWIKIFSLNSSTDDVAPSPSESAGTSLIPTSTHPNSEILSSDDPDPFDFNLPFDFSTLPPLKHLLQPASTPMVAFEDLCKSLEHMWRSPMHLNVKSHEKPTPRVTTNLLINTLRKSNTSHIVKANVVDIIWGAAGVLIHCWDDPAKFDQDFATVIDLVWRDNNSPIQLTAMELSVEIQEFSHRLQIKTCAELFCGSNDAYGPFMDDTGVLQLGRSLLLDILSEKKVAANSLLGSPLRMFGEHRGRKVEWWSSINPDIVASHPECTDLLLKISDAVVRTRNSIKQVFGHGKTKNIESFETQMIYKQLEDGWLLPDVSSTHLQQIQLQVTPDCLNFCHIYVQQEDGMVVSHKFCHPVVMTAVYDFVLGSQVLKAALLLKLQSGSSLSLNIFSLIITTGFLQTAATSDAPEYQTFNTQRLLVEQDLRNGSFRILEWEYPLRLIAYNGYGVAKGNWAEREGEPDRVIERVGVASGIHWADGKLSGGVAHDNVGWPDVILWRQNSANV